jgi:hypothetical protein
LKFSIGKKVGVAGTVSGCPFELYCPYIKMYICDFFVFLYQAEAGITEPQIRLNKSIMARMPRGFCSLSTMYNL